MTGDRWLRELSARDAQAHEDAKAGQPPDPSEGLFTLLMMLAVSAIGLTAGFVIGYLLGTAYCLVAG